MRLWLGVCSLLYLSNESRSSSFESLCISTSCTLSRCRVLPLAASCRLLFRSLSHTCVTSAESTGPRDSNRPTLGETFYFTFSGVAPSQGRAAISSARFPRMNLFCCQTITQTLCGAFCLFMVPFFFFSNQFKASVPEAEPAVLSVSSRKICGIYFETECLPVIYWDVSFVCKTIPMPLSRRTFGIVSNCLSNL